MADSDKNLLEFYGATTYRKGSLIGYHLSNLLGHDVFQMVFSRLVKDHQFKHINSDLFFKYYEIVLTELNRSSDIEILQRFRDEFIDETNGPTITVKSFDYDREKEYLKVEIHAYGIKKYIPGYLVIWDKDLNEIHNWKLDLRPDQENVVFERTQLKLPDEFCVIMNPKAEYYCLTIQCQETINR